MGAGGAVRGQGAVSPIVVLLSSNEWLLAFGGAVKEQGVGGRRGAVSSSVVLFSSNERYTALVHNEHNRIP